MDGDDRRGGRRFRSFLIGGVVGASAAAAALRRDRRRDRRRLRRETQSGLGAFESAPCYRELAERERHDG